MQSLYAACDGTFFILKISLEGGKRESERESEREAVASTDGPHLDGDFPQIAIGPEKSDFYAGSLTRISLGK